jgi:RNA polymerase sigma-70 factor (ECF subfamily)
VVPDIDLINAIGVLAPKQRAAVVLFYLEDRPVEEIARVMGTSTSTVKQHLHRARARLAEVLQEEAVDDVS